MEAAGGLPGSVSYSADVFSVNSGGAEREAAAVAGDGLFLRGEVFDFYLETLDG